MNIEQLFSLMINSDIKDLSDLYVDIKDLRTRLIAIRKIRQKIKELESQEDLAREELRSKWLPKLESNDVIKRMINESKVSINFRD